MLTCKLVWALYYVTKAIPCCAADGESEPAVLAASSARSWLARNAAGIKRINCNPLVAAASVCMSLVFCLPALEHVEFRLPETLHADDLGCLLEALACLPRLSALELVLMGDEDAPGRFPDASAFQELQGLTKLALAFGCDGPRRGLSDILKALAPLTGLAELEVHFSEAAVVPAALAQLKRLQALVFSCISFTVFEAGCLDLPNLTSLEFRCCQFQGVEVLPGMSALQNLTCIEFTDCREGGPPFLTTSLRSFGCSAWSLRQASSAKVGPVGGCLCCQLTWAH